MEWMRFLSSSLQKNYVFQKETYADLISKAAARLNQAEALLIGAGAGLSAAAGLTYSKERFENNFNEFIEIYGREHMPDMYSAGFYPFPTEEARWGYWSKHSYVNRIAPGALPLYSDLYEIAKGKDHFILTTNVDHQFWKAGFEDNVIFATQGDYGRIQCAKACHPKTYDAVELFVQMNQERHNCVVPSNLVPRCPVCGGTMAMNLRCDQYFVEDTHWHLAADRYECFLKEMSNKKVVLLELGVGFNTPVIIRYPFEIMACENKNWTLIRLNLEEAMIPKKLQETALGISGDLADSIRDILEKAKKDENKRRQ